LYGVVFQKNEWAPANIGTAIADWVDHRNSIVKCGFHPAQPVSSRDIARWNSTITSIGATELGGRSAQTRNSTH
jgi:hypothetical protein